MAKRKSSSKTKKSLEAKIAQLEGKLSKLSAQQGQKPAEQAKASPPPPPKASPPPPKPAEAPKPAPKAQAAPPATLESLYESVPVGNWNERKAKTTGFVAENPRAWARRHATGAGEQMRQLNLGFYKKQLLLDTLHLQTSTLQQSKE